MPIETENTLREIKMSSKALLRKDNPKRSDEADEEWWSERTIERDETEEEWWSESTAGRSEIDDEWDDEVACETLTSNGPRP